jgi:ribosomal protein S18 acetylase RimI-like enzyme
MITLKTAGFEDYINIARLHAENWRQNYRGILSDFFLEKNLEKYMNDTWQQKLRLPAEKQYTTIALSGNEIVGFSCLVLDDDPQFGSMLDNLHVATSAQNKGIGKILVKHCAGIISDFAANRRMYLWVYEQNKNAIAVYDRLGGTHFETVEKETAEGSPAIVYRYTWDDISLFR